MGTVSNKYNGTMWSTSE